MEKICHIVIKVIEKMLRTLQIKFDHMVTTIIEPYNIEEMMIAELQGSVGSHVAKILKKLEANRRSFKKYNKFKMTLLKQVKEMKIMQVVKIV